VLLVGVARFFKVVPVVPAFVIGGVTSLTTLITWAVLTNKCFYGLSRFNSDGI
jgi:hypothetical protein